MCRGCVQYPAFAPDTSKVAAGFLVWVFFFFFFFLYLVVQNLPNCSCIQLFLVPYSFFLFCCLRKCLSRCRHCCKRSYVPGPSLSQNGQGVHKGSRLSLTKRVALDEGTWRTQDVRYAQVSTTLVSYLNFLNLVFLVCCCCYCC